MQTNVIAGKKVSLGSSLRSIRKERDWTIAKMSEVTGISIATLSKVENDRRSLTYDKLSKLALALEVDISRLFGVDAQNKHSPMVGRRSVVRTGDGTIMDTGVYTYTYLCQDLINKRFSPVVMELHARSIGEFGELLQHDGEEYAFVLAGEVTLYTEAYAPLHLTVGESVYFDSGVGHAFVNSGNTPARVLNIASHAIGGALGAAAVKLELERKAPPREPKRARILEARKASRPVRARRPR
jgi:transcriptional regulator with XRE-family HTH domain